ncbi:ABC transporter substrate-binding protein [Sulfitobacter sp. M57]|uniref:ABC transporter substrate-binding protein n=1 Tax=unclassified Sulfitobacter TaxID=196795 RepID=UPI0023E13A54|nr:MULTISPECIES: ABC transporter substrate-binding protein [unclassified Sulfitobacter]MDF3415109.1 ABC transporter substrate-binding protein [Sulfitobacter sp. KE5]MDF3422590.1 ABC transporter substrate-binding protein [Sulfitobacter sp. KE43]MDF3433655.1 ABC transporter substrate-binding protein [Sulfitobacter sp. KE42]MDF3459295.1 ABC transporter substrate-binding protein [Sulfitobacter sp. S74]MDF3463194.1 ABC transporter substrate-binding protein [Sulfitobacter sp. Ks18]
MNRFLTTAVALLFAGAATAHEVRVDNCGDPLVFESKPERLIVHDMNMTDMAFALGLQENIVGLTGITGWYKTSPDFDTQRGDIPELAPKYPTLENLVAAKPDLFFAGWYYGMRPGGEVTPDTLRPFGIKTMVLTESCVHLDKERPEATMDLLFNDVLRLGKVMHVEERAETLVAEWRAQLAGIEAGTADLAKPRVFLLDGPADAPFTAGKFAIPDAMIAAAGGENVTHDLDTSWGRTSWEVVAASNPEFLVLLDYQTGNGAEDTFKFLQEHPVMSGTDAVKNGNWIGLRYEELTPGPANIEAIAKMARAMHPDMN